MRNKTWDYSETYDCACGGGRECCGVIGIKDFIDGNYVDIGFSNKKSRYRGNNKNPHILLSRKDAVKLIKFLQKHLMIKK